MTDEHRPDAAGTEGSPNVPEEAAAASAPPDEAGTAVAAPPAPAPAEEEGPAKLHQSVEISDVGPCKKHIKVTVERKDIDGRLSEQFSKLVADSNVAGFRPGKAPRKIIERRFHKEVGEQVKSEVLMASLQQLAEDHDIAPLSPPDLDPADIDLPREGPLVYEFEVEVRPQFDLPQYKGLRLKRPVKTFTDADVAEAERRLLAPDGQVVPKPEGNAQVGDIVIGDLTTRDGDRVLGTIKESSFRVERQLAFKDGLAPRFGEQVKGANPGETRQFDIQMSSAAADRSLAGKAVQGTLEVKDVKALRLPDLTPELLSHYGVNSPGQLHEAVRALLQRQLQYQQRQAARQQVLARIAAASTWELPQDLLARQWRQALSRRIMEMRADGIPEEQIAQRRRLLEQDIYASTALALKEHFVLQKIAEVEKLEVDEDDINDEIERLAAQEDESPRRLRARLEKEGEMDALAAEMIERMALDLILDSAEYEDVPLDQGQVQPDLATVEAQAVPGALRDPAAEAEAAAASEGGSPPAEPPAEPGSAR
jgi:trigger factor